MTNPVSVPVDAEKIVIDYLKPLLPVDVDIDVRGGGGHFVRVRRVGGTELSPHHDEPVLDVIIWHDSDKLRMQLALQLWAALRSAGGDEVGAGVLTYANTVMGPRQMPDPADDTKVVAIFTCELITRPAS